MIDIAIQIINYNTKKYLADCLAGLVSDLKSSAISYRILVLDNDSQDDLSDLEKEHKNKVEFYRSEKNLGFAAGHNYLAKRVESKHILILNPDLKFIEEKTIDRLFAALKRCGNDGAAVIGPKLINKNGPQYWDHGEFLWRFGDYEKKAKLGGLWKNRNAETPVPWVSGAFFLISTEAFSAAQGFDEKFFMYAEENDLCLRLRLMGYKIIYYPEVKVFHFGTVVASKKKGYFKESNIYFLKKHYGWKWPFVYVGVGLILLIVSIFKKGVL